MRTLITALGNGALSFAISLTVVLTAGDDDGTWDRTELALTAGIAAFVSGVCASYFGGNLGQLVRQKALYGPRRTVVTWVSGRNTSSTVSSRS